MNKDNFILKYLQDEVHDAEIGMTELDKCNISKEQAIKDLENNMDQIYLVLNMKKKNQPSSINDDSTRSFVEIDSFPSISYEQLYQKANQSLRSRGLDVESIDYHSLITDAELIELELELNRLLPRREKWEKGDMVAVFIAASVGSLVDVILSDRNNTFTGTGSDFSKWLNQFHKHESGAPIDYQGDGFGGGFHRGLSKGHDVLRFIEAILMFKNGQFEGVRYVNGVAHKVVSTYNQYGNSYEQLGWIEAILKYAQHMFADLLSTSSLPFPGSSFFVEYGNRDLRKLAAKMYKNGFNLKNIMIQSLSTIVIEIIIRIYFGVKSVQEYNTEFELLDDYSNFEAIREFIKPSAKEKLNEMLLMSHAIVTAVNLGKVVITKSPWEINVAEIISVVRYSIPVVNGVVKRHSEYSKLLRNSQEIQESWEQLAIGMSLEDSEKEYIIDELVIV